jgi:hypothetical protein
LFHRNRKGKFSFDIALDGGDTNRGNVCPSSGAGLDSCLVRPDVRGPPLGCMGPFVRHRSPSFEVRSLLVQGDGGIQMKTLENFAGQNYLITPAALAVGESRPASIHDQKFLLVLSGVVNADFKGNSGSQWLYETLYFRPEMTNPQNSGPLNYAISRFGIPKPPVQEFDIGFALEEWASFASLSSIFNQDQSVNSGFAVNTWRHHPFDTGKDIFTNLPVKNIFSGIDVDVAVRDSDAWIYRVGYNVTLLGKIVFLIPYPIP